MSNKDVLLQGLSNQSQAHSGSENPATKVFELELTQSQFKALQKLLPKGYVMEIVNRSRRDASPLPSKKVVTNEGNTSTKGSSTHLLNGTNHSDHGDSNVKSSTREKRRTYSTFEQRYPDFEAIPATSSKTFKPSNEGIKRCSAILQKLRAHHSSTPFLEPVDVDGLGLDDYYDVVSDPMDLSTVDRKLRNGEYNTVNSFAAEVRRIWQNAFSYNPKGSPVYTMALEMSAYFEKLFKEVENYSLNGNARSFEKKVKVSRQNGDYSSKSKFSKSKFSAVMDKPMSIQEKKALANDISKLPPEHLRGVWEIVSKAPNFQKNKEELEFDIDALPPRITRELERYVRNKIIKQDSKNRKKGKESASSKPNSTLGANDMNHSAYEQMNKPQHQHQHISSIDELPIHMMVHQVPEDLVIDEGAEVGHNKSSESSFFSDSDDGGDRVENINVVPKQDLSTFQAGGPGSMLNSFIVK